MPYINIEAVSSPVQSPNTNRQFQARISNTHTKQSTVHGSWSIVHGPVFRWMPYINIEPVSSPVQCPNPNRQFQARTSNTHTKQSTVHGSWFIVHGPVFRLMVDGPVHSLCSVGHGPRSIVHSPWATESTVHGPRFMVHGPWSRLNRPLSSVHGQWPMLLEHSIILFSQYYNPCYTCISNMYNMQTHTAYI